MSQTANPETRRNPLVYLFAKTWQHSMGRTMNIVSYWLMFIASEGIFLIAQPLCMKKIMDMIQEMRVTKETLYFVYLLLFMTVIAKLISWCLHGPARLIERDNAFKTRATYRKSLIKGVMSYPLDWHSDHHSGDTIDKIEKGTQGLYAFASESFQPIYSLIRLLVCFCMLTYFSPPAGFIVLGMIMLTVWITMMFDKVIMANYKILNRFENQISAKVLDAITNIRTIIILRVENHIFETISKKIDEPHELYKKTNVRNELKWFLVSMCCSIMTALVLGTYLWQAVHSPVGILIGSVYILNRYLDQMSDLFFQFTDMYSEVLQRQAKVLNSEELASTFPTGSLVNHVLPENWQRIDVSKINFSYNDEEGRALHLRDVSFSVKRGERIAFVGKSGSGKTTLMQIIRDLYHPESIQLRVDGKEYTEGLSGICRAITLVPQHPEILATTIRENITLGAEYPPEKIDQYVRIACFEEKLRELPKGLESSINERGVNLSGGERQRLALARGLLACEGKSLILLDEPTSSVDLHNEHLIHQAIVNGFPDAAIISSVHKPHLLRYFDRIYMFEAGKVIGSGTFKELHETCSQFRELLKCSGSQN